MKVDTDKKIKKMVKDSYLRPAGVLASRKLKSGSRGSLSSGACGFGLSNVLPLPSLGTFSGAKRGVLSSAIGDMICVLLRLVDAQRSLDGLVTMTMVANKLNPDDGLVFGYGRQVKVVRSASAWLHL